MNPYSVLLVDDEEEVIQIIIKKLDWESLGFRVVGYAHNGVEALEIAEEQQPDVVMTDIKMPYMDGLTLSRRLKELYRDVKIIIFSGFDEFEYAKEAIKIEVEEYLLKPVNAAELSEVFRRIRGNLDREMDERRNIGKLQEYYLESLPLLQENFYISLMEGRIPLDQIEKYRVNYQIKLNGPYYIVTILHVSTTDPDNAMDPFLLTVSVKKLAEEQLKNRWDCCIFTYLGDTVLISQLSRDQDVAGYTDSMDEFCRMAKRICGARVTAGIGPVCSRISELPRSYQGARSAVSYRVLYGNTRAINIAEIDPHEEDDEAWEDQTIRQILKKIRMGGWEELEQILSESMRRFMGYGTSIHKYRVFIMKLIAELSRYCANNKIPMEKVFGADSDGYTRGMQAESPEELWDWLTGICGRLQKIAMKERQDTTTSFVSKAVEYIKKRYSDQNITMEMVCRELGVSAAYFSTVFKKETGKTFTGYLTDYRMEQAVELLIATQDKTYIIAEKVGYADPNYFSYVFKKQYGMSPTRYRNAK